MQDPRSLLKLLNGCQVAELMGVKPCTVRQERIRGKLGFIKIGARILYTEEIIREYFEKQRVAACAYDPKCPDPDRSEITGLASDGGDRAQTMRGIAPGTTSGLDKQAESALAQQIFKRRAER